MVLYIIIKIKGGEKMSRKKWVVSAIDKERCAEISEEYGVSPFTALLVVAKGITDETDLEEFFNEEKIYMSDPYELPDMNKAVNRIRKALEDKEKICVFGDYDADGVTSTALLYGYLREKGADVTYYIPDRNGEGYGMNTEAIEKIRDEGVGLIITVDNGISSFEEAEKISSLGMSLVITDHHRASSELPKAEAVVDAYRLDCESPEFCSWAGVGIVYKLLEALEEDDEGELLGKYSDLAAIGTIGDVVPLTGENRRIVKCGIELLNSSCSTGIEALKNYAGLCDKEFNSSNVAFSLVPRINAAGRMGSAEKAFELLVCDDRDRADELAKEINDTNALRQKTELEILEEAEKYLHANPGMMYDRVLVVDGENWHGGVIGIVAARLVEKYGKPCLVISRQPSKPAKGSGRSIEGFSLYDALKSCGEYLVQFGGHTLAAGLEIEEDKIDTFRRAINDYAAETQSIYPQLHIDCRLNPKYINTELLDAMESLEPFGAGNKKPVFGLYKMMIERVEAVSSGKHCRLTVSREGITLTVMKFGISPNRLDYRVGDMVDMAVTVEKNIFMNTVKASVTVRDIKFSAMDDDKVIEGELLYESIKRNEKITPSAAMSALPTRDLTGRVYRELKKQGTWQWSDETLDYRIGDNGERFCAVKVALDALEELELIKRNVSDNVIELLPVERKMNLDDSKILNTIKGYII